MNTAAAAVIAAESFVAPATVRADDPVPTVDQVVAIMAELTDPDIPAANKTNIVTPGFSPDEVANIDDQLRRLHQGGGCGSYLPARFIVTDVQPAPNNCAGATVAVPKVRRSTPQGPIVMVEQDGHWLITHDTATTALNAFWYNATRPIVHGKSMSC